VTGLPPARGFSWLGEAKPSDKPSGDGFRIPFYIALPYGSNPVAKSLESGHVRRVPPPIGFELLEPERSITLGDRSSMAALVMMPEAAVHEDGPAARAIREVRLPGEVGVPYAI